ncbi:MAG TPA: chemotaxis protein CheA, partial [Sedimentisphaerales bacterium]|nr:chemotaxis protein CheA [Sedimentisphaerales bacterium]
LSGSGKEESEASIEAVTRAIMDMQEMLEKEMDGAPASVTATAPADKPAETIISEEDLPLVMDFVAEAEEHVATGEKALLEIEKNNGNKEAIDQIFRSFHTIKGMAGFLNLSMIGSLAHTAENVLDMARKDKLVIVGAVADTVLEAVDMMKRLLCDLKHAAEAQRPVPVLDGLDAMVSSLRSITEGKIIAEVAKPAAETVKPVAAAPSAPAEHETANKNLSGDDKIKVRTEKLDLLVNMVGELVTAQLMIADGVNSGNREIFELSRRVAHQGKIVRELQELSMSMRMVPISGVFQKMTRLVRDLSQKAGKKIELVVSGEETELDRSIVDSVSDPLVHMIRNSVDHGLETPEERVAAGKDACGKIYLRAFHQAGNIVVEIEDDGRGLNKDKILRKAINQGIVSPGHDLSEDEIHRLILHAGLSTAEKITSVSGRGVGMDVVKSNVELLRGRLDIKSSMGKGTMFTIRLPLTLAVIDGQIVKVGREQYIVPINSIVCSLRPESSQISTVQGKGEMVLIRGELMPFIRLHRLFGVPEAKQEPAKALFMIVEDDNGKCGLMVDDLLGQQQVVIKSLGAGLGKVDGVSGAAIMGDGYVRLILDVSGLKTAWQKT